MRKIKGICVVGAILAVLLIAVGQLFAADAQLIRVQPEGKDKVMGIYIDPPTVYIKKNDIIVWMSGVPGMEVQIVFNDGKTCKDVTANPNLKVPNFYMDAKNCYVTSFLAYCATSTLQFSDPGTFEYKVVNEDGKMEAKGTIIVK
ncbi:exported hypothetical protein [uncultured Desulfobacterium sp.]|uniref:EfeO-type cupredoxin-like domain-containing protein n=1 Tax=uncultured Desulfobacterium sp. TaxID=201089 RepID=A0A445MYY1_9BACT|nr:exported hypothetical protein [uncultured Desulfobacterium sp.]